MFGRKKVEPVRAVSPEWPESFRIQLGTLTLDHRVKHEYGQRPEPQRVKLSVENIAGARVGEFWADFNGHVVDIPEWILRNYFAEQEKLAHSCSLRIRVSW